MSQLVTLGRMSVGAGLALALALGCSSGDSAAPPPGVNSNLANGGHGSATCGNGKLDTGEECDGALLNGATCETATMGAFKGGTLACAPSCVFDMRMCTSTGGGTPPTGTNPPPTGTTPIGGAGSPPIGGAGTTGTGTGGGPGMSGGGANGGSTGVDPGGGQGGAAPPGKMDPIIPMVSGDCPQWQNGTITFMGLAGITIAAGAKPSGPTAPMLIYWHGTGSTAAEYGFMAAPVASGVQAAGGVLVSFQGTTGGDLYSGTNIFGQGDLKIIDQMVACAVKDHNIDPRKIYTMGCSAGGLFSVATAALRSNYIAAAAPNSGGVTVPPAFEGPHIPPLMAVHGKMGSDVVIIDFANASASAEMLWKSKGGFSMDCDTGGGHCGGAGLAGDVWKFFQAHTFGLDPEPYAGGLPAGFSSPCKITQ